MQGRKDFFKIQAISLIREIAETGNLDLIWKKKKKKKKTTVK